MANIRVGHREGGYTYVGGPPNDYRSWASAGRGDVETTLRHFNNMRLGKK